MSNNYHVRAVSLRKNAGADGPQRGETLIRCDRPSGSPLANPFWMADESKRDHVCDQYDVKYDRDKAAKGPMWREVLRIAKLVKQGTAVALGCWCKPKRCHCDRVAREVIEAVETGQV